MNKTYLFFFLLCLTNCTGKKRTCECSEQTFSRIEDALSCFTKTHDTKSDRQDERLMLLAFVKHHVQNYQKKGWNILMDQEIIDAARQNYLLVILDASNFTIPKNLETKELTDKIKSHHDSLFFVITNPKLFPFSDWSCNESKDLILERIEVGDGP